MLIRRVVFVMALGTSWAWAVSAQTGADANASSAETVKALQQRMLADPQLADAVQALRDNPQVQAILDDPELAAALARGDLATLLADPKIKRLADDPTVKNVTRQVSP